MSSLLFTSACCVPLGQLLGRRTQLSCGTVLCIMQILDLGSMCRIKKKSITVSGKKLYLHHEQVAEFFIYLSYTYRPQGTVVLQVVHLHSHSKSQMLILQSRYWRFFPMVCHHSF